SPAGRDGRARAAEDAAESPACTVGLRDDERSGTPRCAGKPTTSPRAVRRRWDGGSIRGGGAVHRGGGGRGRVLPVSGIVTRTAHNGGPRGCRCGASDREGRGAALLPGGGVEADRGGGGEVEALGAAVDGDADRPVGEGDGLLRQAPRLVAEDPGHGTREHSGVGDVVQAALPPAV